MKREKSKKDFALIPFLIFVIVILLLVIFFLVDNSYEIRIEPSLRSEVNAKLETEKESMGGIYGPKSILIKQAQAEAVRRAKPGTNITAEYIYKEGEKILADEYGIQIECDEPPDYYFDEDGVRYVLIDGTTNEYYIDDSYEEEILTPDSTAFTSIGYHPFSKTLWVVFRNTGDGYHYYDVPVGVWNDFKTAESKGSFFQEEIRDQYEYDRD